MDNSIYKKCEVCGQTKHISEFSKSYRNRCKACVAEHTRMVREHSKQEQNRNENTVNRTDMQKVVVKDTGETVWVRPCREPLNARLAFYQTEDGRKFPMFTLKFEQEIDWEKRRYEIAREAICAIMSNEEFYAQVLYEGAELNGRRGIPCNVSHAAVVFADALITELKKGGEK